MKTINEMRRVSDLLLSETAKLYDSEWCDIIEPIVTEDFPKLVNWAERAADWIRGMTGEQLMKHAEPGSVDFEAKQLLSELEP